jgi:hypothetical protein
MFVAICLYGLLNYARILLSERKGNREVSQNIILYVTIAVTKYVCMTGSTYVMYIILFREIKYCFLRSKL